MAPDNYRYYRLDCAGHLDMGDWFAANDDEDAIAQIEVKHPDDMCEVWLGSRLVAKLLPARFSPDDPHLQIAVGQRLSALALRRRLGLET